MRRTRILSLLAVVLCSFWGASPVLAGSLCDPAANPGNLVMNCSFDTGDFTGWTLSGNTTNPGSNYYGVDMFDADNPGASYVSSPTGPDPGAVYGAYLSADCIAASPACGSANPNAGNLALSQTLTLTGAPSYNVSFWLDQDTAPTTGYTHFIQVTFGGVTLLTLTPTVALPGPSNVWTQYTFSGVVPVSGSTLSFTTENDDNYWSLDDSQVDPTPEPAPVFLLGTMLLGSGLFLGKFVKNA